MDRFDQAPQTTKTLEHLKKVQLYLGVTTLVDKSSNNGKFVCVWAITGSGQAHPTVPWPNQGIPSACTRALWRQALRYNFALEQSKNTRLTKGWKFDQLLGEWLTTSLSTYHNNYLDPVTKKMYH
eukprot:14394849-Ditylum_brightwellii.AAC.1